MTDRIHDLLAAGRVVEAGWLSLLATMPPEARENEAQLRTAFYAGAHYLFENLVRAARNESDVTLEKLNREFDEYLDVRLFFTPAAGNA